MTDSRTNYRSEHRGRAAIRGLLVAAPFFLFLAGLAVLWYFFGP